MTTERTHGGRAGGPHGWSEPNVPKPTRYFRPFQAIAKTSRFSAPKNIEVLRRKCGDLFVEKIYAGHKLLVLARFFCLRALSELNVFLERRLYPDPPARRPKENNGINNKSTLHQPVPVQGWV